MCDQNSPWKSSGSPVSHIAKMARKAPTIPHAGDGPVKGGAVPLFDLRPDLGTEAEGEAAFREQLKIVGLMSQLHRSHGMRWRRLLASSRAAVAPAARISGVKTSCGPSNVKAPSTPSCFH